MRITNALLSIFLTVSLFGCHHSQQPQPLVSDNPAPTTSVESQTPTIPATTPSTSTDDDAIIATVLAHGDSKDLAASPTNDRAVVFGDNFPGTPAELHECVGDAKKNVLNLVKIDKFDPKNIRLILNEKCTKANYESWATWVMADAKPGDRRFFANSSHGAEDTDTQGNIVDVLVTFDMIQKNVWDSTTEVSPEFWANLLRSTTTDFLFLNDSCHAGGQMRKVFGITGFKRNRLVRSIDGPPAVQDRLNAAAQRGVSLRSLTLSGSVVWACQPSELSEEDSDHGGLGTDAFWKARKNLLATNPKIGDVIREANRILHSELAATQHEGLTGANKPLYSKD